MSVNTIYAPRLIDLLPLDELSAFSRATRRRILGVLGGIGARGLLGPVAGAQEGTPETAAIAEWTFSDATGKTVTLPTRPERIVAELSAAAALWDFGIRPIAVVGWTVETDAAWGNVDRTTPVINADAGAADPDLEALVALNPDVYITLSNSREKTPYEFSFRDAESYQQTNQIVPVIGIAEQGFADERIARFAELAGLLGADLEGAEIKEARARYEAAVDAFKALVNEHPDLTTLFVHAGSEWEGVANPSDFPDLGLYQELGLNIIEPDAEPGSYWESLSVEQAMTYQSDVLFQSARADALSVDDLSAHPIYGRLPAVEAGQIAPWNQDLIQSYQGLTAALEGVIAALENAKDVTE